MDSMIHALHSDHWQIGVLPSTGASLAYGRINHTGVGTGNWVNFMRPTPAEEMTQANHTSSYPLIPWSNRIRDAVFTYAGEQIKLKPNWPDGTAIHGVARQFAWDIIDADDTHIGMSFDSREYTDVNWPFAFATDIDYRVDGDTFTVTTNITNFDDRTMPAGFGHHPFFMKALTSPEDRVQLQLPFTHVLARETDSILPRYEPPIPIETDPRVDFRTLRAIPADAENILIDDCLVGRIGSDPVRLIYPSGVEIHMDSDPIFQTLVFYCPADKPVYAVEPVTNSNDGFNRLARGLPDHNVIELNPGDSISGAFSFRKVR